MSESVKQRAERAKLEIIMRKIAGELSQSVPPGIGFALLIFDFGATGSLAFASSGDRVGTIAMMREFLGKLEAGEIGSAS